MIKRSSSATERRLTGSSGPAVLPLRGRLDRDEVLLGRAIDADAKEGDAFTKLARYERSLERSLFRALDELRHIQDKRQNRPSSPILDAITLNTEGTE